VIAAIDVDDADPAGGVRLHPGGPLTLTGTGEWFVVELSYLDSFPKGHRA
jgi:hypothetical protein